MPGGLHPPLEVIESWPAPDYEHPERQGVELVVLTIFFSSFGIAAVGARIYSRVIITKAPGWDDALAVMSLVFALALSVLVIFAYEKLGTGTRIWDFSLDKAAPNRLVTWLSEWCFILASTCVKISVLLFYKRLSAPFTKAFLIATWVGIIYNILYTLAFGLVLILMCTPVEAYWNQFDVSWIQEGHKFKCGNENISLPISGAFSVIGDFYTTLLPLMLVYNISLPPRQKKALYALFGVGFLVVVAGIVRTYYLDYLINRSYDVLWYLYVMWVWTLFELYFAIIAASAPALKPFLRRYLVQHITSRYDYARSGSEGGTRHTYVTSNPFGFKKGSGYVNESLTTVTTVTTHSDIENQKSNYELTTRSIPAPIPENAITAETTIHVQSNSRKSIQQQQQRQQLGQTDMSPLPMNLRPSSPTSTRTSTTNSSSWANNTRQTSTRDNKLQRNRSNTATTTSTNASTIIGSIGSTQTLTTIPSSTSKSTKIPPSFDSSSRPQKEQHYYHASESKGSSRYSTQHRRVMNNIDFSTSPTGSFKDTYLTETLEDESSSQHRHEQPQVPRDFVYDGGRMRGRG